MKRRHLVLATSALDPAALPVLAPECDLRVSPDESSATLRREIADADAIIVRVRLPDDIFDHARRLKSCVRHGVGVDYIPVEAATRAGIPVANLLAANTQGVVEHVAATVLLLARDLHRLASDYRSRGWAAARQGYAGFELSGRTLGVVGLGRTGRGVAAALHHGFGMKVIGYGPRAAPLPPFIEPVELDAVFARSDVVTLHAPLTAGTKGLVNAQRLALMRAGAILVNTARGGLIDDGALVAALESGGLRAAALDVFDPEPLPEDHPFLRTRNLFLTPHTAAATRESLARMSVQSAEETLRILRGERPLSLVNPEVWDTYLKRHRAEATR